MIEDALLTAGFNTLIESSTNPHVLMQIYVIDPKDSDKFKISYVVEVRRGSRG